MTFPCLGMVFACVSRQCLGFIKGSNGQREKNMETTMSYRGHFRPGCSFQGFGFSSPCVLFSKVVVGMTVCWPGRDFDPTP